jgi:hypothetical protein
VRSAGQNGRWAIRHSFRTAQYLNKFVHSNAHYDRGAEKIFSGKQKKTIFEDSF